MRPRGWEVSREAETEREKWVRKTDRDKETGNELVNVKKLTSEFSKLRESQVLSKAAITTG